MIRAVCTSILLLAPLSAAAELTHSSDHGFSVEHSLTTAADAARVYRTMTDHIDQWWNGDHSWSVDAANLYLTVERGGCFCERLPNGGFVEHLRLIYVSPGSELRFDGALGPLQTMAVQGRMVWKIEAAEGGSKVTFTYHIHGHPAGGLSGIAPAVDGVIGEQLTRLGKRLEAN